MRGPLGSARGVPELKDVSYDIQIWSVDPIPLPDALPDVEKWQQEGGAWVRASKDWQIVIGSSVKVLFEDVPEDVARVVPGISYLAELNLEPIGAPKSAHKLLSTVSKRLGKAAHGVVLDPQADTVITPSGVKRYRPQRRAERFSILALSWWFTEGPLLTDAGLHEFVSLLERMLPEAMPKRYGLFEPPQHLYAETGREHFLGFLQEHLDDIIVWYPHRPVVDVSVSCSPKWGAVRQGFRANYVTVDVEAKTLEQTGWNTALDRFWRVASQVIQPFYGDVRTLKGFTRMGATCGSDIETDFHPVKGPWWIGIPRIVGHAVVLGEPYLSLWSRFVEAAQVADGLAFLSTNEWTTQEEVSNLTGGVPDTLAQRWIPKWVATSYGGKAVNWNTEYPPIWPFENVGAG
jgi:hypothetical protein